MSTPGGYGRTHVLSGLQGLRIATDTIHLVVGGTSKPLAGWSSGPWWQSYTRTDLFHQYQQQVYTLKIHFLYILVSKPLFPHKQNIWIGKIW